MLYSLFVIESRINYIMKILPDSEYQNQNQKHFTDPGGNCSIYNFGWCLTGSDTFALPIKSESHAVVTIHQTAVAR